MFQEIIALIIIASFLARLFWQKKRQHIASAEFLFWLIFWSGSAVIIIFIKQIDQLVARLGFSGTGIQVLFYLAVALLFYFIFKIRLRLERTEKNLTKLTEYLAREEFNKSKN